MMQSRRLVKRRRGQEEVDNPTQKFDEKKVDDVNTENPKEDTVNKANEEEVTAHPDQESGEEEKEADPKKQAVWQVDIPLVKVQRPTIIKKEDEHTFDHDETDVERIEEIKYPDEGENKMIQ